MWHLWFDQASVVSDVNPHTRLTCFFKVSRFPLPLSPTPPLPPRRPVQNASPDSSSDKKKKKKKKKKSPSLDGAASPASPADAAAPDASMPPPPPGPFRTPPKKGAKAGGGSSGKKKKKSPGTVGSAKKTVTFGMNMEKGERVGRRDRQAAGMVHGVKGWARCPPNHWLVQM